MNLDISSTLNEILSLFRSGHLQMFFIVRVLLKYFVIFTRKHLCWSISLIKLQAFRPVTPVNIVIFL